MSFRCPACHRISHNANDAREQYCGACHVFWTELMPGAYDDNRGGLHLVMSELLKSNNYPDTAENRATLLEAARSLCNGLHIQVVSE